MTNFGKGQTLRQSCKFLRDPMSRWARILEATERNSVIEGLPPFSEETEKKFLAELRMIAA